MNVWTTACLLAALLAAQPFPTEHRVDLTSDDASGHWMFPERTAMLRDGELVCDGRQKMSRAFYLPCEWDDVRLQARFLVEPQEDGVLACGFIVRAADSSTYYYVHFDRTQAILVRSDSSVSWNELKRVGGLRKPAGEWHQAALECAGDTLRVFLNGQLLYTFQDKRIAKGRIGFYANQGIAHIKDIVVQGECRSPESDFRSPPRPFVYVCEDAGAGGYEAFPDVCRLQDGRLMAVFYAGYGHVSLPNEQLPRGGRIAYCTSSDEGRTWSAPRVLYDGPHDDRDPSIAQLRSGRLICNFFSLAKSDQPPKKWIGQGSWMIMSDDGGKTWSSPRRLAKDAYCSAPIRELSTGRLILGMYRETQGSAQGAVIYSDDGGDTWSDLVPIDNGGRRLDAETDIIERTDGTLYAVQRPTMCYSISRDWGETWSVSRPIGFPGHCPYLLRTADGTIVLAHRIPATSLHWSRDECRTWSDNVQVDEVGGAYPSMVNLQDGSVLIVYYEEGKGSSIRARRFRLRDGQLEWLPLAP